jgi:hypothetical protein
VQIPRTAEPYLDVILVAEWVCMDCSGESFEERREWSNEFLDDNLGTLDMGEHG